MPEYHPVEVSPAELALYSGVYTIEGGPEINLSLDESSLWLTWSGQTDREALIPVEKGEFVSSHSPLNRISFPKNEGGQVTGLEIRNQYGKTWLKAKRIEKALPVEEIND